MLGRLILIVLQAIAAWGAGPIVRQYIPVSGALDLFVWAGVFAIIAYIVGILAALIIKDVGSPSPAALTASFIVALIAAAIATYGMDLIPQLPGGTISKRGLVLGGAILGYLLRQKNKARCPLGAAPFRPITHTQKVFARLVGPLGQLVRTHAITVSVRQRYYTAPMMMAATKPNDRSVATTFSLIKKSMSYLAKRFRGDPEVRTGAKGG
jgi:hypothetical protein